MLNLTRMLKSTIYNGSQNLWLQQEIPEPTAVDGDVIALDNPLLFRVSSILSCLSSLYKKKSAI